MLVSCYMHCQHLKQCKVCYDSDINCNILVLKDKMKCFGTIYTSTHTVMKVIYPSTS